MATQKRVRAMLAAKRTKVPRVLTVAKAVRAGIGSQPGLFGACPVDMATLDAQIQAVDELQVKARRRELGAAALRDERRDVLWSSLETIRVFVQALCDASPEQAQSLIQSAGMKVAKDTARVKPPLGLRKGPEQGSVIAEAYVALAVTGHGGRFFNWEHRVGEAWIPLPSTPGGSTVIGGLPRLATVGVRFSVTTMEGTGPWSQEVTFLVR